MTTATWRLGALDPLGSLDELEPLREVVGDARVVAVGEAAHGQSEYGSAHFAVLRFLVERLGFTVFALESGFSEGLLVERFVTGAVAGDALGVAWYGMTYGMGASREMADRLQWMRDHNARAAVPVHYVGVDLPGGCGAVAPALGTVRSALAPLDAALAALVVAVEEAVSAVDAADAAAAATRYAALTAAQRDAITLALAALHARVATLAHTYRSLAGPEHVATALHELELALWLDRHWRWADADPSLAGEPVGGAVVAGMPRDAGMAATVEWLLGRRPEARVLLVAANGHVQRIASGFGTTGPLAPCGAHLADVLGEAYLSIGVTAQRGETVSLVPDVAAPGGSRVVPTPLPEPEDGSVEAAVVGGEGAVLRDLRRAPVGADRLRHWERFRRVDVDRAHDAVIVLPHVRVMERPAQPDRPEALRRS